jgi:hypothetical protein
MRLSTTPSTGTSREKLDKLISFHIQESIEINTTETELLECSLLWHSCCCYLGFNISLKKSNKLTIQTMQNQNRRIEI